MKNIVLIIALIIGTLSIAQAQQTLKIDINKSIINWTGHAEVGPYAPAGTLNIKSGTVKLKGNQVAAADIVIDMTTMKQDNDDLIAHLKDEDFFDVKKFPASTIKITGVVNGKAIGKLTIKGKSRDITIPVKIDRTNAELTISGETTIDRTQYGVVYNSTSFFSGLGDKAIRNTFDLAFKIVVGL